MYQQTKTISDAALISPLEIDRIYFDTSLNPVQVGLITKSQPWICFRIRTEESSAGGFTQSTPFPHSIFQLLTNRIINMKHHSPTREAGLNGPILKSLTAHHHSRKGWRAGSSMAEVKTASSCDSFYSVADEYPFPHTLAKETALHINSVTESSKKSYSLNKHLMIHHFKSTGIHLLHCNVFQSPVSICSSLVSNI